MTQRVTDSRFTSFKRHRNRNVLTSYPHFFFEGCRMKFNGFFRTIKTYFTICVRLENVETQLNRIEDRLNAIDNRIDYLHERIDKIYDYLINNRKRF